MHKDLPLRAPQAHPLAFYLAQPGQGEKGCGYDGSMLEIIAIATLVSALVPLLWPKVFGNGQD